MTKLAFVLESGREVSVPLTDHMPLGRLAEMTAALTDLKQAHDEAIEAVELLRTERDQKVSLIQHLKSECESRTDELESLTSERDALLASIESLNERNEATLLDVRKLEITAKEKEADLDRLNERISDARARVQESQSSATAHEAEAKATRQQFEHLTRLRIQADGELKSTLQGLAEAKSALQENQQRCEGLKQQKETLTKELADLETVHGERQKQVLDLEGRISFLEAERNGAEAKSAETLRLKDEAEQALAKTLADLEAQRSDVEAAHQTLQSHESALARAKKELIEIDSSKQKTEASLAAAQETLSSTENLIETANETLAGLEEAVSKKTDRSKCLDQSIADSEIQVAELNGKLTALNQTKEDTTKTISELSERREQLESSIEELSASEAREQARLAQAKTEADDFDQTQTLRVAELQGQIDAAQKELAQLETRLLPLRDWKLVMDKRQAELKALPSDSVEARNLRNDMEMAMATLRHLLSAPSSNCWGSSQNTPNATLQRLGVTSSSDK